MRLRIASLLVVCALAGCSKSDSPVTQHPPGGNADKSTPAEQRASANEAFAFDLYSALRKEKGNLFFSPYSISSALAMTYTGARGETAKEMAEVLHFSETPQRIHESFAGINAALEDVQKAGQVQLNVANSLWPQQDYPLLPDYLGQIKQYYGATVTPVDYRKAAEEARKLINTWVENKTNGKIKDLIRPGDLDPQVVLALVNAIYFKGKWTHPFDPKHTTSATFNLLDGTTVQVPMMRQARKFRCANIKGGQVLELPYVGDRLSMVIVLPRHHADLPDFERQLGQGELDSWLNALSSHTVNVGLPRFKITWGSFVLNETLKRLGMRKAFRGEADFSAMSGTADWFIGLVTHKAFVEVNEEGTEAAAATAVLMKRNGGSVYSFYADRPFLFLVREKATGSILFLGRLMNPVEE